MVHCTPQCSKIAINVNTAYIYYQKFGRAGLMNLCICGQMTLLKTDDKKAKIDA